ncbi:hypothetical protein HanRHA438_Chr07g0306351 [Helianthus annuus]|nr:hypothetical protein HanRHA438_Chr07g0306351 [Helianthus annuus]
MKDGYTQRKILKGCNLQEIERVCKASCNYFSWYSFRLLHRVIVSSFLTIKDLAHAKGVYELEQGLARFDYVVGLTIKINKTSLSLIGNPSSYLLLAITVTIVLLFDIFFTIIVGFYFANEGGIILNQGAFGSQSSHAGLSSSTYHVPS